MSYLYDTDKHIVTTSLVTANYLNMNRIVEVDLEILSLMKWLIRQVTGRWLNGSSFATKDYVVNMGAADEKKQLTSQAHIEWAGNEIRKTINRKQGHKKGVVFVCKILNCRI